MEDAGRSPPLDLLAITATALQTARDGGGAEAVLLKGTHLLDPEAADADLGQLSRFLFARGRRQIQAGDPDGALITFEQLSNIQTKRGNEHQYAVARQHRRHPLRPRRSRRRAAHPPRRDVAGLHPPRRILSIALTQGQIADILFARGDLDAALRIRTEEELPVYTRLGDIRSMPRGPRLLRR
jgi:hypothetical protein